MTTLTERFGTEAWNSIWRIPFCGLAGGMAGIFYASYSKLPIEEAAKAYAITGAVMAIFKCLINITTDDPKKNAMLEVGVFSVVTTVAVENLRRMNLLGDRLAIAIMTIYALATYSVLQQHKLI